MQRRGDAAETDDGTKCAKVSAKTEYRTQNSLWRSSRSIKISVGSNDGSQSDTVRILAQSL